MKTFARIDGGVVVEVIGPMVDAQGHEVAITDRFHPDFVTGLVDVTGRTVAPGYSYVAGSLTPPVAPVVDPNAAILAQIAQIEGATMVPRITREEMMRNAERWAAFDATSANTAAMILAANAGYQRVKAVDDQIRALRAKLK